MLVQSFWELALPSTMRRRRVRFSDLKPPARKEHVADDGKNCRASPVRFVCGCAKGHLQEIEWRRMLHSGGAACDQRQMWLVDSSTSADFRDTKIACDCGKSLTLEELAQPGRLGHCRGERPWIGDRDPTRCDAPEGLKLLARSATNTYFPQVVTVISLPQADGAAPAVPQAGLMQAAQLQDLDRAAPPSPGRRSAPPRRCPMHGPDIAGATGSTARS